jgi:hypothetical protein
MLWAAFSLFAFATLGVGPQVQALALGGSSQPRNAAFGSPVPLHRASFQSEDSASLAGSGPVFFGPP